MSKGGGTQTTQTAPPKYAAPYLNTGMREALRMYNGGTAPSLSVTPGGTGSGAGNGIIGGVLGGALDPGNPSGTGVNTNPYQVTGNQIAYDRATRGDPTISAAQNYVQNTLGGGFLGGNPYADAMFNKMALATQGQLASQFAGAGRNVDQSQGLRAQQLGDMATSFYGGLYDAERNRQQGVLPYAQSLGNQAYTDAAAVGNLQQPEGTALDDYLRRINSSTFGSSVTAGNKGFSGGGALGGAMLGNMIFPGLGGIIGGGLLGGLF